MDGAQKSTVLTSGSAKQSAAWALPILNFLFLTNDTSVNGGKQPDKMWSTCSDFNMPLIISCISNRDMLKYKKLSENGWNVETHTCRQATKKSGWQRLEEAAAYLDICLGHLDITPDCKASWTFFLCNTMFLLPHSLISVLHLIGLQIQLVSRSNRSYPRNILYN